MTTDIGRKYVLSRLVQAPDLETLRKVWGSIGVDYQSDPVVIELNKQLEKEHGG